MYAHAHMHVGMCMHRQQIRKQTWNNSITMAKKTFVASVKKFTLMGLNLKPPSTLHMYTRIGCMKIERLSSTIQSYRNAQACCNEIQRGENLYTVSSNHTRVWDQKTWKCYAIKKIFIIQILFIKTDFK